jgi:hypothetical protein
LRRHIHTTRCLWANSGRPTRAVDGPIQRS